MEFPGRICVVGSGSWASAIAKILLSDGRRKIHWYIRKPLVIQQFKQTGHNPSYLSQVEYDTSRIRFFSNLNVAINNSDTLVMATPSPYLKPTLRTVRADAMADKYVLTAIKGIVPDEYMPVSQYLNEIFNVPYDHICALGGPCHAEEVAFERLSYLTFASCDTSLAEKMASCFNCRFIHTTTTDDILGIEYGSTLKNVYAIASGICNGLKYGDNFQAVLVANAIKEMNRFVEVACPGFTRDIVNSVYLGDLLVTSYSKYSRNRTFGTMIGKGYSVKTAQIEMEMIAEGYYGTKCIKQLNDSKFHVDMPILEAVYGVLYERIAPSIEIKLLSQHLH